MYFYVLQDYENRSPLARQGSRKVVFLWPTILVWISLNLSTTLVSLIISVKYIKLLFLLIILLMDSSCSYQNFLLMIKAMLSSVLNRPLIIMKISFSFMLKIVYDQRHNCIVPICFKLLLLIFPFLNLDNAIFNFIIYQL